MTDEIEKVDEPPNPFQFSIKSVIILTAVVAVFCALYTQVSSKIAIAFLLVSFLSLLLICRRQITLMRAQGVMPIMRIMVVLIGLAQIVEGFMFFQDSDMRKAYFFGVALITISLLTVASVLWEKRSAWKIAGVINLAASVIWVGAAICSLELFYGELVSYQGAAFQFSLFLAAPSLINGTLLISLVGKCKREKK